MANRVMTSGLSEVRNGRMLFKISVLCCSACLSYPRVNSMLTSNIHKLNGFAIVVP
jgi:hypothetical protein